MGSAQTMRLVVPNLTNALALHILGQTA